MNNNTILEGLGLETFKIAVFKSCLQTFGGHFRSCHNNKMKTNMAI